MGLGGVALSALLADEQSAAAEVSLRSRPDPRIFPGEPAALSTSFVPEDHRTLTPGIQNPLSPNGRERQSPFLEPHRFLHPSDSNNAVNPGSKCLNCFRSSGHTSTSWRS